MIRLTLSGEILTDQEAIDQLAITVEDEHIVHLTLDENIVRSFMISNDLDVKRMTAALGQDGILTIKIPTIQITSDVKERMISKASKVARRFNIPFSGKTVKRI